jgi:uncharacterized protein (DUF58 family)
VFLVSDFMDEGFEKVLKVSARRHDLIAVSICDRRELELPDVGKILLEDAETGELLEVNTSDKKMRERFKVEALESRNQSKARLSKAGIDVIELETGIPYQLELKKFFQRRIRRAGR